MRNVRVIGMFALLATLAGASVAVAQMGRAPQFQGVWNPVVGSGAVYLTESKGERGERKSEMEIAIVDKETVEGKTGYWLEYTIQDPRGGATYMKHLIIQSGKDTIVQRMIMQVPSMPQPVEMSMEMVRHSGTAADQVADVREISELVGNESVTTPAGTFQCAHWRRKDGSADVWLNDKVYPRGLVKSIGKDSNMTLVRVLTNAKTHITGTPTKYDPMEMMRQRRNP